MKLKLLLGTSLLSISMAHAFAGAGSSGGGNAVVCYEGDSIKSAVLFDFYEGRNVFGDVLDTDQGYEELLNKSLKNLDSSAYSITAGFTQARSVRDLVKHIENKKRFISKDAELAPIKDSFEVATPKNCKIMQAAAFIDEGTILFDRNIWDHFSEFDKAGLILHEAIYWYGRMSSYKFDSRRSRRVVSLASSEDWKFEDIREGIPKTFTMCESRNAGPATGIGKTVFVVFDSGKNRIIQFIFLDGDPVLSKKFIDTGVGTPLTDRNINDLTSYSFDGETDSMYEGGDSIQLYNTTKPDAAGRATRSLIEIIGSSKPSYPAKDLADQVLNCRPETISTLF